MTNTAAQIPERVTRGYQQEMLEESLHSNIIIALDTGAGKTHIAILRMKMEAEREAKKISWFVAPTVTLCEQQKSVIGASLPVSVGYISGAMEPTQWKNPVLWQKILQTHRVMVSTPQVLLDALRHGYVALGRDINLIVFDEAHHATRDHPYNQIMKEFYFFLPKRIASGVNDSNPVRPMIMGLTASPIYGGNAATAFKIIEKNLDSTIRAPMIHRSELSKFVHKPLFTHLTYADHVPGFSTNLASLEAVEKRLNIENDPYVISLRRGLNNATAGSPEWRKLDQKLSKTLKNKDTFVHKGIRDLCLSARYLLETIGTWSTDWFVYTVIMAAKKAANPYDMMVSGWKSAEKKYLLKILDMVNPTEISICEDDILDELSPKVTSLINSLLGQKFDEEARDEAFSGIIFVERRHAVLALVEILNFHPFTKDVFRVGCLLGQSDSSFRHSLLDITRYMSKEDQKDTLRDFRSGDKNLLVCTAVAEEGIDIQACGSVIRWDAPVNMASWAQSRGRARRRRSTFTLMFSAGGDGKERVLKWERLEKEMVQLYNDPSRLHVANDDDGDEDDFEYDPLEFRAESGALLTLHSAIPHLAHFCSLIPRTAHVDPRPLFAIDPPDMPEGWHALDSMLQVDPGPTGPPYGCTVTLPRCLHLPVREFSVPKIYQNKASAHRHAAFKAYMTLYENGLLNESLLPTISVINPKDEELQTLLRDVEKRVGMANVSLQMNPWLPDPDDTADRTDLWWCSKLIIEDLVEFYLYTRREPMELSDEAITLHHPTRGTIRVYLTDPQQVSEASEPIDNAREYTRNLFWCFNGSRMKWDQLDFAYLLLPCDSDSTWQERYEDVMNSEEHYRVTPEDEISVRADLFGEMFDYPDDITIVRKGIVNGKPFRFERWRMEDEPLTEEEEEELRRFNRDDDLDITYPLLVVRALPRRTNFLLPNKEVSGELPLQIKYHLLIPEETRIPLLSPDELESSFLLPSILRAVGMLSTVNSLSRSLFSGSPLSVMPVTSLMPAITAPAAGERDNYQRLETLGDTVLKFITAVQLLAQHPHWHEGFLTRQKDHTVSNGNLAKVNLKRTIYRWIIRDRLLSKKWKPLYESELLIENSPLEPRAKDEDEDDGGDNKKVKKYNKKNENTKKKPKKQRKTQDLSTKVLADVIESLIGAAYVYGGHDLGFECMKHFKLGTVLAPLDKRIEEILGRVETTENVPSQLSTVEDMIGYTFQRKLLLIEALTHASYENELNTPSYERMEFLGDAVLDMVVTDYLFNAPGKKYSPGHMHLRRSAVVNTHFLAYLCLRTSTKVETKMPQLIKSPQNQNGKDSNSNSRSWTPSFELVADEQEIYLWKCILHSSPHVLEDQTKTFDSFVKWRRSIESDLGQGKIFPWAPLTRLQAPKFFSDIIESIIGAVYLDSRGDLSPGGAVQHVMRKLGILDVLEWIVKDDVDIFHPVSRVFQWANKNGKDVEYKFQKQKGTISCTILLDGEEVLVRRDQVPILNDVVSASVVGVKAANGELEEDRVVLKAVDLYRGKVSEGEVKFAVAEAAIKVFNLRGVDENAMIMAKKKNPPKKKKGKGKSTEDSTRMQE